MQTLSSKTIDRFWAKVDQSPGPDDCWPWTASCMKATGYGQFNCGGGDIQLAHRVMYVLTYGSIPHQLYIDHTCHNEDVSCPGGKECLHRRCQNPAHLEAITNKENINRADEHRGRGRYRTHCPSGHEYTEANTRMVKRTGRSYEYERACKTCLHARSLARSSKS